MLMNSAPSKIAFVVSSANKESNMFNVYVTYYDALTPTLYASDLTETEALSLADELNDNPDFDGHAIVREED